MKNPLRHYTAFCKSITLAIVCIGLLSLAGAGAAQANGQGNGISDPLSPHNFAAADWNFRGEICRVCHVPHDHGRTTYLYENGLLWNHQVSAPAYTMYSSETVTHAQEGAPMGIAKLCLGCHDGSVAVNQFDKNANGDATYTDPDTLEVINYTEIFIGDIDIDFKMPNGRIPFDLQGTHPISISYTGSDPNMNLPSSTMGSSGTIADVLDNGLVQCSSCHDVHDQESVPDTHLLRVSNNLSTGDGVPSGLCLTCHKK